MDMIERVAEAIRRNKFVRTGRIGVYEPGLCSPEELGEARAAIEAMRDLNFAMIEAGVREPQKLPVTIWQAMIDAALTPSLEKA